MTTSSRSNGEGGVRPRRFLLVAVPATIGALSILPAIAFGWVSVAIASARPMDVVTSSGTADTFYLAVGSDRSVTGLSATGDQRNVALVDISGAELDDLCLVARADLPLLGRWGSLRIASSSGVRLGDVVLAAPRGGMQRLDVGAVDLGAAAGYHPGGLGGPGAFSIQAHGDNVVTMTGVRLTTYGLVLEHGIRLTSLHIHPALGDQTC